MLDENIKTLRKAKGLSQEELAVKLNVVRQTVSKWEQGLSVPDSDMLIALSEVFETPVSRLLGENIEKEKEDDIRIISEKLEVINMQLAERKREKRKGRHIFYIAAAALLVLLAVILIVSDSPYLNWDYSDPELAVAGTIYHAFEFVFFRLAPFVLAGLAAGIILTREKQ